MAASTRIKSLERMLRRGLIAAARLGSVPGDFSSEQLPEAPRILLVRTDRIGDAIISTPTIALLRDRFPLARIDMLFSRKNAAVQDMLPGIDNYRTFGGSPNMVMDTIRRLRRTRYDMAINLVANDSATAMLATRLAGARIRIGFSGADAAAYDLPVPRPDAAMHIVSETSLLLQPLGIQPIGIEPQSRSERLRVKLPADLVERSRAAVQSLAASTPSAPIIGINISGSGPEKFWGIENFVALATALRKAGLTPVFAGSPSYRDELSLLSSRTGNPVLPLTQSYREFAAMLSAVDLVLTPDTSVTHLSAALGKPTVVLIAANSENIAWSPWGTPHRICRHNQSIAAIPLDDVLTATLSLVTETIAPTQSSPAP